LVLVVLGQYQLQLAVKVQIQYLAPLHQLVEVVESLEVQPLPCLKQMVVQVVVVTEKVRYLTSRQQVMVIPRQLHHLKVAMVVLERNQQGLALEAVVAAQVPQEVLEQRVLAVLVEMAAMEPQHQFQVRL
jgi:hypothetical protein